MTNTVINLDSVSSDSVGVKYQILGRSGQDPENALDLESGPDQESGQKDQSAAAAEIEKRGQDHVIARKVHPKVQDQSDLVLDRKGQKGRNLKKEGKNQSLLRKIREGRLRHLLKERSVSGLKIPQICLLLTSNELS